MSQNRSRTLIAMAAVMAMSMLPLVGAESATALGNNRIVNRSCGKNFVYSARTGSGPYVYLATTSYISGSCTGTLSVAFQYTNGVRTTRVYGDRSYASISRTSKSSTRVAYGLHWGCDSCNVTYS